MNIELLVLPGCPNEAPARRLIDAALSDGHLADAVIRTTIVGSEQEAIERDFVGSPTILVNGRDPFAQPGTPAGFACRVYGTAEGLRGVPTLRALREALEDAAKRRLPLVAPIA